MAIDNSIALNANRPPVPDVFSGVERGMNLAALGMKPAQIQQQIEASKTQQAATEAQIPGLQAQSATLQAQAEGIRQDQDANNYMIQLAKDPKYIKEDGTADIPRLIGATSAKFPKQAVAFGKSYFDTQYQGEVARTQAAIASGTEADTAGKFNKMGNDLVQTIANVVDKSGVPDDQKATAFEQAIKNAALAHPAAFAGSPYVTITPGQPAGKGPDGQPTPAVPPTVELKAPITGSTVKQVAAGSMTPLISAELAISQNKLELEKLTTSLGYKAGAATILPAGDAAAIKLKAADARQYASFISKGVDADVSSVGGGAPGAILQQVWQQAVAKGGPAFQLQAALDKYNQANNQQYTVWGNGVKAVKDLLRTEATVKQSFATDLYNISTPTIPAGTPNVPGVKSVPTPAVPTPPPSGNAQDAPPWPGATRWANKAGKQSWVAPGKEGAARAAGYLPVGKQ